MKQSYKDFKEEVTAEQKDKSYDEIKEDMQGRSEFMLELDNLPSQNHIWINRGAKMTCENAGHPWHEVWLKRK